MPSKKNQHRLLLVGAGIVIVVILVAGSKDLESNRSNSAFDGILGGGYDGEEEAGGKFMPMTAPSVGMHEETAYDMDMAQEPERMVIRSGALWAVVADVRVAVKDITDHADSIGGFTVTTEVQEYLPESGVRATVEIRVPQERFAEVIAFVRANVLRVTSEQVSGQDITEEFVDNQARLGNLQATETQLLSIMQKAYKIEDVLAVQRELTSIREQIERLEARQKFLRESVAMSKISVYLSTDEQHLPIIEEQTPWQPIAVAKSALRSLITTFQFLAEVVIWIVIFLPVWGTAWLLHRRYQRKGKKK
ncbi:MAG: DUF4349 domain-containing protein [Candidatus Peribacteraceae bacterium]|nr:DUF4349 domain-containing protein [Candidatus Peribacteraceae bacterium]